MHLDIHMHIFLNLEKVLVEGIIYLTQKTRLEKLGTLGHGKLFTYLIKPKSCVLVSL